MAPLWIFPPYSRITPLPFRQFALKRALATWVVDLCEVFGQYRDLPEIGGYSVILPDFQIALLLN